MEVAAQVFLWFFAFLYIYVFLNARTQIKDKPELEHLSGVALNVATFIALIPAIIAVWVAIQLH